ncbi:hypothetical protein N7532_009100, partial [Penicillium argentinense]
PYNSFFSKPSSSQTHHTQNSTSMSSRSPRGRSPIRSPLRMRSRSLRQSRSPRNDSRSRSITRSPSRGRTRSRSHSRDSRNYRGRSYSRTPSRTPSPPKSAKIVIEKLTKNVTENHLREIFGSFGEIENIDLPMNRAFMTNKGTAYILYYDPADAEAAIAHMHEAQLDGAILNVSIILPRRAFSRSPPPAANRGQGGRFGFRNGSYAKSPPRRHARARPGERHDVYRPPSLSRSRSPIRSRSYSRSRSPVRKGGYRSKSPRNRRRRSPSYGSYDYSRSPTPNRGRSRN